MFLSSITCKDYIYYIERIKLPYERNDEICNIFRSAHTLQLCSLDMDKVKSE